VQGLLDDLVGHLGPVRVAGVDVGDAELDRLAQDANGLVVVRGRTHDVRAGQLHRAVPETGDGQIVRELEGGTGESRRSHASTVR
jgi:hypothetical protein